MPSRRQPLMEVSENDAPGSIATENRRVSQRAVRAPEKFVPDAPSLRSGNTGAKRKRGVAGNAEDVENEPEEEDDSEEEEEEESADEEEIRQTKRRANPTRKPASKKAKVNGAAPSAPAPAIRLPNRQKKPKRVVIQDANAEGVFGKCIKAIHFR